MKGRELKFVRKHWPGCRGNCPSCQVAWHFNLWRQFCHCGKPATGYRAMGPNIDVEFFCDEHFQDVPRADVPHETPDTVGPVGVSDPVVP